MEGVVDYTGLLSVVLAYLLGSIPFGLVLTRAAGLDDIRQVGSGNIGATNVLRTSGKFLAGLTLLLDGGKAAVAVLVTGFLAPAYTPIAGAAAFLGHLFPVWLGFKGGKGVATFIGLMLAIAWPVGLACCATWLLVAVTARYSSLSALISAALSPIYAYSFAGPEIVLLSSALAAIIFWRHADNIRRLLKGEEPKIGSRHESAAD